MLFRRTRHLQFDLEKADQGMKTWTRAKASSSSTKKSPPGQSTASTTPVHCAGGNVGNSEQENVIEEGKTCYSEGQDICNLIWNRVDQGMKTWTKAKAIQSSLRGSSPVQSTTSTTPCAMRWWERWEK